jgi:hypothetical protein
MHILRKTSGLIAAMLFTIGGASHAQTINHENDELIEDMRLDIGAKRLEIVRLNRIIEDMRSTLNLTDAMLRVDCKNSKIPVCESFRIGGNANRPGFIDLHKYLHNSMNLK